jgi:hypothetical protein
LGLKLLRERLDEIEPQRRCHLWVEPFWQSDAIVGNKERDGVAFDRFEADLDVSSAPVRKGVFQ